MGKIFFAFLILSTCCISLFHPWVGVVVGYLFSVMDIPHIWWWHFEGLRPFFYISIFTIAGFLLKVLQSKVNWFLIYNKNTLFLLIWFLFIVISFYFGPFVHVYNKWRFYDVNLIFDRYQKIFLFYIIAVLLIDDRRKLKYFIVPIIAATIYLTYWANNQYLSGYWKGRLMGPHDLSWHGTYVDQNAFAMLFVVGLPFLFFWGLYIRNKWKKFLLWLIIPFGWHAVFLTGSRGGLVGVAVTILVTIFRSPQKILALVVIPAFLIAYEWQAGSVMKERAKTISKYEEESSSQARINAWKAAIAMIKAHPISGVGLGSFGQAFPYFSDKKPRVAHNTFFQIAAENGIIAGIAYLLLFLNSIRILVFGSHFFKKHDRFLYFVNESLIVSLLGFFVCSLFLSLHLMEIFFYLMVMVNFLYTYSKNSKTMEGVK